MLYINQNIIPRAKEFSFFSCLIFFFFVCSMWKYTHFAIVIQLQFVPSLSFDANNGACAPMCSTTGKKSNNNNNISSTTSSSSSIYCQELFSVFLLEVRCLAHDQQHIETAIASRMVDFIQYTMLDNILIQFTVKFTG